MTAAIKKFELFDRAIAERLLDQDDSIVTPNDKKMITKLLRKAKGNLLEVNYNFARGLENLGIGRLYPAGSQSLGCMNGIIIRAPMCEKYYFDIDTVNAHYTIAWQYAAKKNLPFTQMKNYCDHREECLEQAQELYAIDRFDAKLLFIKLAYGGYLPEDCPSMKKTVDIKNYLPDLQLEMKNLAEYVWATNPNWHTRKLKEGGPNKKFKMLSLFLQTEERKILLAMDKAFTADGRSVDILIHDGCMIRKNENEQEFPRELMDDCQDFVEAYTGYRIKLEQKPIVMEWELQEKVEEEDEPRNRDNEDPFWKEHFVMEGKIYRESIHYERPRCIQSGSTYAMQFYKMFDCQADQTLHRICMAPKRQYTQFGFYPYGAECPPEIYNTFKGFKWTELYGRPGRLSNEEYYALIEEIKETPTTLKDEALWETSATRWQIEDIFCHDDDPEKKKYNIKYFANILGNRLFAPTKPCEKVLCLRNETGGSGKTGFMERAFAEKILGYEYFASNSMAKHVFGEFNSSISSKLLILCEEAETKDTKEFTANIKAAVTRKSNPIRLMRTDIFNEANYVVYIANTNKQTAFEFDPGNHRRFPQIDCKEYRLSPEEIYLLRNESEDPHIMKLLFEYILSLYDPDFNFDLHPDTQSVRKLEDQFKDPFLQFFEIILYHWDDYYNEKYRDYEMKTYDLHKLDKWTIKSEEFCELFIKVSADIISKKFAETVKYAAFRQSKHLVELKNKYPSYFKVKLVTYNKKSASKLQLGTYYIIELKTFRSFYNPEFVAKAREPPTMEDILFDQESIAKKQRK